MRRILFVDDEPLVLEGLQRMLRSRRHAWQMQFAAGGAEAIQQIDAHPFDVVVCDMQMPGIDGLAVLKHVRDRHPHVVRIVLSGQTKLETMTRVLPIAHQFLTKPCDAGILTAVIERVCGLQSLLNDPTLLRIVGRSDDLPVLPSVYARLCETLDDPEASLRDVVGIVEQDVALSARCLQFANSAFFGLPRRVSALDQAVAYLGIAMLRDLVISSAVFSSFRAEGALTHVDLQRIEQHAFRVATLARQLLNDPGLGQQAFLAGMFHDLGGLILTARGHKAADYCSDEVRTTQVDGRLSAMIQAATGAYLLGLWGLPHAIVEAVAYHASPERIVPEPFDATGAVYVADQLVIEVEHNDVPTSENLSTKLGSFLEAAGVADHLPRWRELAVGLVSQAAE